MRRWIALSAVVLGLSASILPASPAAAAGCGAVTEVPTPAGSLYIDDRDAASGDVWVYLESNGVAGLQAGGTHAALGYTDEGCPNDTEGSESDTLLV